MTIFNTHALFSPDLKYLVSFAVVDFGIIKMMSYFDVLTRG